MLDVGIFIGYLADVEMEENECFYELVFVLDQVIDNI